MKNKLQIKKQLRSAKHLEKPIVLVPYKQNSSGKIKKVLERISKYAHS